MVLILVCRLQITSTTSTSTAGGFLELFWICSVSFFLPVVFWNYFGLFEDTSTQFMSGRPSVARSRLTGLLHLFTPQVYTILCAFGRPSHLHLACILLHFSLISSNKVAFFSLIFVLMSHCCMACSSCQDLRSVDGKHTTPAIGRPR